MRPRLLGSIDAMVQKYIQAASNRGSVITRDVALNIAKVLMKKNPNLIGNIDLSSSHWAQSLYRRKGFVCRRATTAKVALREGAIKETRLLFYHDIVSQVEKYKIPDSLIINIDQTPTKFVQVGRSTSL